MSERLMDEQVMARPVSESIEMNPLLERAASYLTHEWQAYADLPKEELLDWGAYHNLALWGIAEMKLLSPYIVNTDGDRIYFGTRFEFRLSSLWGSEPIAVHELEQLKLF